MIGVRLTGQLVRRLRSRVIVLSVLAVGATAACDSTPHTNRTSVAADPADSIFIPARRLRFYRDPDTNEPAVTLVVSLQHGNTTRFILAQSRMHGDELAVVSDSAGLIPVFGSEREARAYIANVFPLDQSGADTSADAIVAEYGKLLGSAGPLRADFDRAVAWAGNPAGRGAGPTQLAIVWELLAAADAAPPMAQFDPMGMVGLNERAQGNGADSLAARVTLVGMMLTGMVSELRRSGAGENAGWPASTREFWTAENDALLARLIRTGIVHVTSRLSPDAARRDVTRTWPAPRAPQLVATFLGNGRTTLDVQLANPGPLSPQEIDDFVRGQLSNTTEPERAAVSAPARARYARDRDSYASDLRAYIQASRAHDDAARRIVRMRVWLTNTGDREATPLSVRFHVPSDVVVVPSGTDRYGPLSPDEPLSPSSYESAAAARKRWDPRPRASYRERGETSMYNSRQQVAPGPGGTTLVEHPVVVIPGGEGGETGELMVQFRDWHSIKPFDIDVEILIAGRAVSTSRLHINASVRGR